MDIEHLNLPEGTTIENGVVTLPTIYKRTSKGDFQQSIMRVEVVSGTPTVITAFGKVGGKQQESTKEIFDAKSQATVLDQALFTARSMWQKKIDGAYSTKMSDKVDFRPSLAHKYHEKIKYVDLEAADDKGLVFVQAKLNGIRGNLLEDDGRPILQSRTGKDVSSGNEHIVNCFAYFADKRVVLDGEIYAHGMSLQEISGAARRSAESSELKFYVYDVYWLDYPDLSYSDRFWNNDIHDLIRELASQGLPIDTVDNLTNTICIDPSAHDDFHEEIERVHSLLAGPEGNQNDNGLGFEGVMIRLNTYPYKLNGRSTGLLKKKWFIDCEAEIIDVWTPATGKMKGQAMFRVRMHAFNDPTKPVIEFDLTPMGDFATREKYLLDKDLIIGKMLTLKFVEYSNDGVPLNANAVAIRDYE